MRMPGMHVSNATCLVLAFAFAGIWSSVDLADVAPKGLAARILIGSSAISQSEPALPANSAIDVAQAASGPPTIESLSPASGRVGTSVTVVGTNFTTENVVRFHGNRISFDAGSPVAAISPTSLRFVLTTCPSYAPQCPGVYIPPGVYGVTVANANGVSNQARFTVTSAQ